mgnify:CR=1 FL=1
MLNQRSRLEDPRTDLVYKSSYLFIPVVLVLYMQITVSTNVGFSVIVQLFLSTFLSLFFAAGGFIAGLGLRSVPVVKGFLGIFLLLFAVFWHGFLLLFVGGTGGLLSIPDGLYWSASAAEGIFYLVLGVTWWIGLSSGLKVEPLKHFFGVQGFLPKVGGPHYVSEDERCASFRLRDGAWERVYYPWYPILFLGLFRGAVVWVLCSLALGLLFKVTSEWLVLLPILFAQLAFLLFARGKYLQHQREEQVVIRIDEKQRKVLFSGDFLGELAVSFERLSMWSTGRGTPNPNRVLLRVAQVLHPGTTAVPFDWTMGLCIFWQMRRTMKSR